MDKPTILVSNDDGIYSPGLKVLYESVYDLGKTYVIAPETPKSSSGLGLTLHKPLRLQEMHLWGTKIYAINGTPSDVIHLASNVLTDKIDLVVSGVNVGDNTSVQVILSSGTVGVAAQAGLLGIPSIAFSAAIEGQEAFEDDIYVSFLRKTIREFVWYVARKGLPRGVDVLNVNFPRDLGLETDIKLARPARLRFLEYMEERVDPRGKKYYWLYGKPVEPEEGTDVYVVIKEGNIAVTPISFNLYPLDQQSIAEAENIVYEVRKRVKQRFIHPE
ncbi:MAG: 5'/3'-nucleotidase SurE [Desulfurococcales archaeon]|nr:5'/3'-nucleotidase SurE [Desulfurococcales archaeon]